MPAENQKLPPIESLTELPVEMAADFLDHDEIASPAMPVIAKDGTIFFYDSKLKQVFKTHLDNHTLLPISRQGEGPKEYIDVRDMLIDGKYIYIIDAKQKLLCFDIDGIYQWEKRTDTRYDNLLAKRGDAFYLVGTSYDRSDFFNKSLFKWVEGQKRSLVSQLPQLYAKVEAMTPGHKKIENAVGIFLFARPVFCVCKDKDMIITAANNQYQFNILNTNGGKIKTITINAPPPEDNKYQKKFKELFKDKPYAISDIFCEPPHIIIISNYFRDDKPRVDFFSMEGMLKKSFLMPVNMNPETIIFNRRGRLAEIVNGFLLYIDLDEVGFRVYRIKPGVIN